MLSNLLHYTKQVILNSGYILRYTYLIYYLSLLSDPREWVSFFPGGVGGVKGSGVSSKQEITWRERQSETPTPLPDRKLPLGRLFTVPC